MKSWKEYAKWIKNEKPHYNLNHDLTSTDKKLRKRAKKAKKFKKKWGFRYEHTWCLDQEIAKFVLPRLAYLRDHHCGYPSCLCEFDRNYLPINEEEAEKQWVQILDDMCIAFELIIKDEIGGTKEEFERRQATIKKGLELFTKYFQNLWD